MESCLTFQRGDTGNRFADNLLSFCKYFYIKSGLSCYDTLYKNLPIPSTHILKSNLQEKRMEHSKIYFNELKLYLEKNNYPLDVIISEDATRITERLEYDPNTNEIYGLLPPNDPDKGMPKENYFLASSPKVVQNFIEEFRFAPYVQVLVAKPTVLGK